MTLRDTIRIILREETTDENVVCDNCGWSWKLSDGGKDPYTCHKCGHTNHTTKQSNDNRSSVILKSIDRNGIMSTLKIFKGAGVYEILRDPSFLEQVNFKEKHDFIKSILDYFDGTLSFSLIDEDPVFYGENLSNGEYKEINHLSKNTAMVDVYDLTFDNHLGEFKVMYYNMSDNLLNQIVIKLLNVGQQLALF